MKIRTIFNSLMSRIIIYLGLSNLSSENKSERVFEASNMLMVIIGADISSDKFSVKSNKFLGFIVIPLSTCAISMLYSFYIYRNNVDKLLSLVVIFLIISQAIIKIYVFVQRQNQMKILKDLCRKIILELGAIEEQECFEKWIIIGISINSFFGVLAVSCFFLLAVLPFIFTFVSDQFVLNYDFIIPFTDPNELSGFIINYTFQTSLIMVGCIGFAGAANVVVNFILHLSSFFECSEIYLNQLDDIRNYYKYKCCQVEIVFKGLINIHNINKKFLENFEMSFQFYHFFDLALSTLAIVVCIYGLFLVRKYKQEIQRFILIQLLAVTFLSSWICFATWFIGIDILFLLLRRNS